MYYESMHTKQPLLFKLKALLTAMPCQMAIKSIAGEVMTAKTRRESRIGILPVCRGMGIDYEALGLISRCFQRVNCRAEMVELAKSFSRTDGLAAE